MFNVNDFRWLSANDACMPEFSNWSRPYEYAFILNKIKSLSIKNPSIHNTCCGYSSLHLQFAKKLNELSTNCTHSDIKKDFYFKEIETKYYDITTANDKMFDVVICVSSLEDVYSETKPDNLKICFNNLINQVSIGGRLLITCDYPGVPLWYCEDMIGQKITNEKTKLSYANSILPDLNFKIGAEYHIIVMDLIKC